MSRKTHAWTDSTIRDDFPDKLRIAIDRMDAKTRRTTFRVIAKASAASGFEPPSGPESTWSNRGTRSTRPV